MLTKNAQYLQAVPEKKTATQKLQKFKTRYLMFLV